MWELNHKKAECQRTDAFKLRCWGRLLRVLVQQRDQTSQSWRKSNLNIHWMDWWWIWISSNLATWCKEPTHWRRTWWEWQRMDCWMTSLINWHEFEQTLGDSDGQGILHAEVQEVTKSQTQPSDWAMNNYPLPNNVTETGNTHTHTHTHKHTQRCAISIYNPR